MKTSQIRLLANELTQIGLNYRGFTCMGEMMTKALVKGLNDGLTERREQAALLERVADKLDGEDKSALLELAAKLREQ